MQVTTIGLDIAKKREVDALATLTLGPYMTTTQLIGA